jgi:hypothetical protein
VDDVSAEVAGPRKSGPLSESELRWLHDKYERLASEEGQLTASRTSYFAAIGTVLVTGLVVAIADLINQPWVLAAVVTFLASLGLLISSVWAVLLHRTTDAQNLWREAALRLEQTTPLLPGVLRAPITLRSGAQLTVDLTRPYEAHALRFSPTAGISWMDRINPATLMEVLPQSFLAIWVVAPVVIWAWVLTGH